MTESSLRSVTSDVFSPGGAVGLLADALIERWLLIAPKSNPAMLEMFADRDTPPYRNLMPWAGEFAGKYLTSAAEIYRLTRDDRLRAWIDEFVTILISYQADDGYLGPWPADSRLTNFSPHHGESGKATWDTWGHYHIITGLLEWHAITGHAEALEAACRIADLLCTRYLGGERRLVDTGSTEMNLAPAHGLARLYRETGTERYLELSLSIVEQFAARSADGPLAGDYLNAALAGKYLHEMAKPRWESLHPIMAFAELYRITSDDKYRVALETIYWGIVEHDRHNNGGFSAGERATGNPYARGAIETCCTIAWLAMSAEVLELSGSSIVADEIELTTRNSGLGMHSPTGRWATYSTPEDGARFASAHSIVFQARSGSSELNCCSVNSPRAIGLIARWALMHRREDPGPETIVLNYYGESTMTTRLADGTRVTFEEVTDYPASGRIVLRVMTELPVFFNLELRIPHWSHRSAVTLIPGGQGSAGENAVKAAGSRRQPAGAETPIPGSYYSISRRWQANDTVVIDLDMSLHFWAGERDAERMVSIYRGPILLAFDQRYNRNSGDPSVAAVDGPERVPDDPHAVGRDLLDIPTLDPEGLRISPAEWDGWLPPAMLFDVAVGEGDNRPVRLCDFASAGATGTLYRSWLPTKKRLRTAPFSRTAPLRSVGVSDRSQTDSTSGEGGRG